MDVKIDTKEKFVVISPNTQELTANMTEEFTKMLLPYLQKDIPHIILNMSAIKTVDEKAGEALAIFNRSFMRIIVPWSFANCNQR
jgi:hypothetical protein